MVTLGNESLAMEEPIYLKIFRDGEIVTQNDYDQSLLHLHLPKDHRLALNQVRIDDEEHHLRQWVVTGKGTYVGTWSKRLAKYIFKSSGIKLDPKTVSILSERVSRSFKTDPTDLTLTFSKTKWSPGTFGEKSDSCWFPGRMYGKSMEALLESDEGGAIKLHTKSGEARARCWYWNVDDSLLIFNCYDRQRKITLLSMARMLSVHFGMNYIKHDEVICSSTYVNGRTFYAVGNPPITRLVSLDFALRKTSPLINLQTEPGVVVYHSNTCCRKCGSDSFGKLVLMDGSTACHGCAQECAQCENIFMRSAMTYSSHDGNYVCFDCRDLYTVCPDCEDIYLTSAHDECPECRGRLGQTCECCGEQTTATNPAFLDHRHQVVCQNCRSEYYSDCHFCHESYHTDESGVSFYNVVDDYVCEDCAGRRLYYCDRCEEYGQGSGTSVGGTQTWCDDCTDNHASACTRCEEMNDIDDLTYVIISGMEEDSTWCSSCVQDHSTYCDPCGRYYTDDLDHQHDDDEDDEGEDDEEEHSEEP